MSQKGLINVFVLIATEKFETGQTEATGMEAGDLSLVLGLASVATLALLRLDGGC